MDLGELLGGGGGPAVVRAVAIPDGCRRAAGAARGAVGRGGVPDRLALRPRAPRRRVPRPRPLVLLRLQRALQCPRRRRQVRFFSRPPSNDSHHLPPPPTPFLQFPTASQCDASGLHVPLTVANYEVPAPYTHRNEQPAEYPSNFVEQSMPKCLPGVCTMSKTKANEYIGMPRYRLKSDLKPKGMRKKGFEKQTIWKKRQRRQSCPLLSLGAQPGDPTYIVSPLPQ